MGCTVRELQDRMDAHEFAEHMIDHEIEPWPEDKLDVLFAGLRMQVAASTPSDKRQTLKLKDFLIQWETPKPESAKDMMSKLKAFAARHNRRLEGK